MPFHDIVEWEAHWQPVPINPKYHGRNVGSSELGLTEIPEDWHLLTCTCGEEITGWNSAVCAGKAVAHTEHSNAATDLVALLGELA